MVGEQILHYEVIELLGRGAMGSVYKALDTRLDTFRTLKFLNLGLRDLESAREHLVPEAKTQAQLIHPNIATLLTLEIAGDEAFLVIEYIDGNPLDVFLAEENPGLKDRLRLLLPIANALAAAHQRNIIHRDIKPSNILVGRDGSVKVTDFGLAKAIGHTELSKTGETKGSVLYMPPEAFRGERVREPADVWSLGVVSYEVLAGQPPFEGESFEAIGYRILREECPALSSKVQQALPGIDRFLDGCLDKDPEHRIQNGQEAFQHLREVAEKAGVAYSAPVVRPARVRKRRMSRKQLAVRLGLPSLIVLAATTIFFRDLFPQDPIMTLDLPLLWGEDNPTWDPSGNRVAYLIGDYPKSIMVIRETRKDAGPEHLPIPADLGLSQLRWSRNDSTLVLNGPRGVILYNVNTRTWRRLTDVHVRDANWSTDGRWIVWVNQQERFEGLEVAQNPISDNGSEMPDFNIRTIPIEGLPTPVEYLGIYSPVFTHGDTRIAFALYRMAANLGLWSVPIEGGMATCILSGEEYQLWNLQWDHVREELIAKEHWGGRLFRLRIGGEAGVVRSVTQVDFPPGEVEAIWAFDYHPESEQYILFTTRETWQIWSSQLDPDQRRFKPLVTEFRQTLTPAVSPDQTALYFVGVDLKNGVLIQKYDLASGACDDLHEPTGDFGSENYPRVDPREGRYVIFTANPGNIPGTLCNYDLRQQRFRTIPELSRNGRVVTPCWSLDGRYIYYQFIPEEETAPRHILRVEVDRTGIDLRVGPPDTLMSGQGFMLPLPGPEDRYLLYQRGTGGEAFLMILDLESGFSQELVQGEYPALSPSRNDVYFRSGDAICRIIDWQQGPFEMERVVGFPPGVSGMGVGPALAVSDEAVFAILTYEAPGSIRVYKMP